MENNMKRLLMLFVVAATLCVSACDLVKLPAAQPEPLVQKSAAQNWSDDMSNLFYHTAQGSEIVPYDWLLALEQPVIPMTIFGEVPLFIENDYLSRFGFLPSAKNSLNPDGLPVGFVKDERWFNPHTGERTVMAGLTCASCHTGQLVVNKNNQAYALRVEGGAAMIDLQRFEKALGAAVILTKKLPLRFDRFARRVLGNEYSSENKAALKEKMTDFIKVGLREQALFKKYNVFPHEPGFGRVDALNRIGNEVFGLEIDPKNLYTANAPVAYPHLWGAGWFDFVQYNGSVPQPLVRNVGEALGVKTPFVGKGKAEDLFKSTVHVDNLWKMEEWLSGPEPYQGLRSPKWPEELFGTIDLEKAAQGEQLYNQHCVSCHFPGGDVLEQDRLSAEPKYWTATNYRGDRLLKLIVTDLDVIGTDPKQATDFIERQADTGESIGKGEMLAGAALDYITTKVTERYFLDNNIPEAAQIAWNNGHKIGAESARVIKAYKARPLDGIWATPPFLHNGAVPSIYDLLSPVEQRPKKFALGTHDFDTNKLGYITSAFKNATEFDASVEGNSNSGHEFANKTGAGVIGPELSEEQRYQLIEYIKTL
jgi:mono/diheme cytochrome c family protein